MLTILRWGVIAAFFLCLGSLLILVLKTFSFGKKPLYAKSQGEWKKGVFYALGKGMMPWEKESARRHMVSYLAGILYHGAIFTTLFYLFSLVMTLEIRGSLVFLIQVIIGLGFICGIGIFIKRIILTPLRKMSCADDFAANFMVDVFLVLGLLNSFYPLLKPYFYLVSILLFLYIPLGKIRHCVFFFYVRILFGRFYGRRGVLPPKIRYEI